MEVQIKFQTAVKKKASEQAFLLEPFFFFLKFLYLLMAWKTFLIIKFHMPKIQNFTENIFVQCSPDMGLKF